LAESHHAHARHLLLQLARERLVDLEGEHQRVRPDALGDHAREDACSGAELDHGVRRAQPHVLDHQLGEAQGARHHRAGPERLPDEGRQHAAVVAHGGHPTREV
jgi:hypothetical protein